MSGEEISHEELMRLFEAARWAPSSFNTQQWRALYARRGTEHWQTFFDLLVDANKTWAKNAAVLVVFISRKTLRSRQRTVSDAFVRLWSSVGEFRVARLSTGSGGARDARIRLRSGAQRAADPGRIPSRSDGSCRETRSERITS